MDLREQVGFHTRRHPWESARIRAIKRLLHGRIREKTRVLDIGCGDGYCSRELFREMAPKEIMALDVNLTTEKIAKLSLRSPGIQFVNTYAALADAKFDVVLLLDVLEHIIDDRDFLEEIVNRHLAVNGIILISAPLFQNLFTSHDRFLGHQRRYSLSGLQEVVESCGLQCLASGYLFTSLLFPRFFSVVFERAFDIMPGTHHGVGNWKAGPFITRLIELVLILDNNVSIMLNRVGIRIPGLSGWALCKKQR